MDVFVRKIRLSKEKVPYLGFYRHFLIDTEVDDKKETIA